MTNIDRYNSFIADSNNIWLDRFTWKGLDGRSPKNKVSIVNFEKQTGSFAALEPVVNAKSFFNAISKLAEKYVQWCLTKNIYDDEEQSSLRNFFVGAVGEYFFAYLINNVKCMLIKNHKTDKLERFDFDNVCPRLDGEPDYGIDMTGMVSYGQKYYQCAMQVKFWNPESDTPITNKIASSAFADAVLNEFIDLADKKNIIVCWLGDTRKVSMYLKENTKLYEHIGFIDMYVLDTSVNEHMPNFWNNLYEELKNISVFK